MLRVGHARPLQNRRGEAYPTRTKPQGRGIPDPYKTAGARHARPGQNRRGEAYPTRTKPLGRGIPDPYKTAGARHARPGQNRRGEACLARDRHSFRYARIPSRNICVASIIKINPISLSSAFTPLSPSRRRNSPDSSRIATVAPQAISSAPTR